MSVIPCRKNDALRIKIREYVEILKEEAHTLGNHGLDADEFYRSGVFRGAIERIRGQYAASMREKRDFVRHVLNYMQDRDYIQEWESAGESNRHDYSVLLNSRKTAVIELKGCLDGNNTTIFERPPHAEEFLVWGVCLNPSADPRHNAWSGIHTRLSAEIISEAKLVDGVIIWDMVCGTIGRPCPKTEESPERCTEVGPYQLVPPCVYVFPATIPSPRNNPHPPPQALQDLELLNAFHQCFGGMPEEVSYVDFEVHYAGSDIIRTTRVTRNGEIQRESDPTSIKRAK